MTPETLSRRADFLAAARARRAASPGMILQARQRQDPSRPAPIRVGFTCSKKIGNAVARNRAKRRLRAVARTILPEFGQMGWDYVLIGRAGVTVSRPFSELCADLKSGLAKIHSSAKRRPN